MDDVAVFEDDELVLPESPEEHFVWKIDDVEKE